MKRQFVVLGAALVAYALVSGCAGPNPFVGTEGAHGVAGFWSGLWHGATFPFAFIGSLFNHDIQIYEVHNSGNWYNFGFVLGSGALIGGGR